MESPESTLAKESMTHVDELVLIMLRDGKERLASDLLPVLEASVLGYTGVAALPERLNQDARRKAELANAISRLVLAGEIETHGAGNKKKLKLTTLPEWLERRKSSLDQVEEASRGSVLQRLRDGQWHPSHVLLIVLQAQNSPDVGEIGKYVVAHSALESLVRQESCIRRSSGQKGSVEWCEELKLAGPVQETNATPPDDAAPREAAAREIEVAASTAREGGPKVDSRGPDTSKMGGACRSDATSACLMQVAIDVATEPENAALENAPGNSAESASQQEIAVPDSPGAEADEQDVPIPQLPAGFRPTNSMAKVAEIESDKIDLDDEDVLPLQDVDGLSESIDSLGMLELPAVRPSPVEGRFRCVFGRRRLRECRKKNWARIPCIVLDVDDRTAELVSIDENLIRSELSVLDRAESLRRRKQIYEELYPQAARPKGGRPPKNDETVAPFTTDAAKRTNSSARKVQLDIEIATNLTEPAKRVLRQTEFADRTTVLAKLSKQAPRDQLPVAKLLAKRQATSVPDALRILEQRRQSKGDTGDGSDADDLAAPLASQVESIIGSFEIQNGDSLSLLPKHSPGRFRLIVADPPQNEGVDYGDGSAADKLANDQYVAWTRKWLDLSVPLLSEDGGLWLATRDSYVQSVRELLIQVGLHPRSWVKVYEPPGEVTSSGFRQSTLHLLHCTKSADRYAFFPEGLERSIDRSVGEDKALKSLGSKLTDDVWIIPKLKPTDGERIPVFPVQRRKCLLQPIIRSCSAAGDWILDPFSGSATTGVVALEEGRNYMGIEKNAVFAEQSRSRLSAATATASPQEEGK